MTLALTITAAWLFAVTTVTCGVFAVVLHRHDPEDDTTAGILIAVGSLTLWGFLAVTGLTA